MGKFERTYEHLLSRLNSLRKREKRLSLAEGLSIFLMLAAAASILSIATEAIFHLNSNVRLGLLIFSVLVYLGTFTWFIGRPLFLFFFKSHSPDDISLALKVGHQFSHIRDRLADALQVFKKHQQNPEGYSLELADASLITIDEEVKNIDFASAASTQPLKRALKFCFVAILIFASIFLIFFSSFINASIRIAHPLKDYPKNLGLVLRVSPGNADVVKGESVEIKAEVQGAELPQLDLFMKQKEAREFEQVSLSKKGGNQFAFLLENCRDDVDYFVQAEAVKSPEYTISVKELPFIRNLQVKLLYPAYSKLGSQFLDENVGDVTALRGTKVEVTLKVNKTLSAAKIRFDDQREVPLQISGQEVTGAFVLNASGSYTYHLEDKEGLTNADPIEYRLELIDDQYPVVEITFPGQDVDLGKDMLLPVTVEAQDDFGFSKIRIGYRILQGGIQEGDLQFFTLPLSKDVKDRVLLNTTWDFSKLGIFPQDVVTYYAEAFDNDQVSGPKAARSSVYRVRFPSVYEMYEEVAREHEETSEDLEQVYEDSKSLKSALDEVVQEMKRDPELNWEQKQKVQEAAQSQEKMSQELEQVSQKLDEMINRMEQNDLLSPETLEKYRELQTLMEEMMTPELQEALKELQKSMEDIDPQKLKEAMEKFSMSQEEFLKSMERTLNLLKKLQIEQKLDESVRKAQDLLRRQEELNQKTQSSPEKQKGSKYSQEQKGIQKDTENLSQDLQELQKSMSEFPQMPQARIESAQNQIEQGLQPKQQRAVQQFQQGEMSSANQTGQQISQDMQELLESLQTAQKELSEQQKQKIMQAMKRSSHDLLQLSKGQEDLMESTQGMDRNSPGMNQLADEQQDLLSGLSRVTNQLYELSQNTFFVTPQIGKALGESVSGMQEALKGFEERNSGQASQNQAQAMSGLNEAASELRKSMQSLSAASSGIGFQEMMQRLMGISNDQQGINQQTSQLGQNPGGLSPQQQAAMSRLAAEQHAVQKSLEQLLKEAGNRSDILGDLQQVSGDMEEVVKELQRKNVDRSTIERQKRILSRLLDAQRSVHDRDYSRKRKAETAKEYQAFSPGELSFAKDKQEDRLRNELLRALKEGYSKDYKELIQKYFEALARAQQEGALDN